MFNARGCTSCIQCTVVTACVTQCCSTTLDKKRNHPRDSRREERCSRCDIMLDQARSLQGKSCGQSRIAFALRQSRLIEHDITPGTAFFSPRISMMVLFFVQGSRNVQYSFRHNLCNQKSRISPKQCELLKNRSVGDHCVLHFPLHLGALSL